MTVFTYNTTIVCIPFGKRKERLPQIINGETLIFHY